MEALDEGRKSDDVKGVFKHGAGMSGACLSRYQVPTQLWEWIPAVTYHAENSARALDRQRFLQGWLRIVRSM